MHDDLALMHAGTQVNMYNLFRERRARHATRRETWRAVFASVEGQLRRRFRLIPIGELRRRPEFRTGIFFSFQSDSCATRHAALVEIEIFDR